MKKNYIHRIAMPLAALTGILTACNDDFLTVYPTTQIAAGAPATQDVIDQQLVSAYQPLIFENYTDGNLVSVITFGDLRSDDLYKGGGGMEDQVNLYYHACYTNTAENVLSGHWGVYFTGLQRCNAALQSCNNASGVPASILGRLRGEALTLRAYYVMQLWLGYGNIPYYEETPGPPYFMAPQLSADAVYAEIMEDLEAAIAIEDFPLNTTGTAAGRINKAMAMMTRARAVMYQKDQSRYSSVLADMNTIIGSGEFALITTSPDPALTTNPVEWIFLREGEFCKESIFEANHLSVGGRDWGSQWSGYGNYLPGCCSPRATINDPTGKYDDGWGLFTVQRGTYERVFDEAGDYRKEASVKEWAAGTYSPGFQNTGLFMHKYAGRKGYNNHPTATGTRLKLLYDNNVRTYRLAEAYLNAAELSYYLEGQGAAQTYLDAIRNRAFGGTPPAMTATLENIKLECHRELFGEGRRFYDLVRWGSDETGRTTAEVLSVDDDTYSMHRTWRDCKKYLPIPKAEIDKTKGAGAPYELVQNVCE